MRKLFFCLFMLLLFTGCHKKNTPQADLEKDPSTEGNPAWNNASDIKYLLSVNGCAAGVTKSKQPLLGKKDMRDLQLSAKMGTPKIIAQGDSLIYTRETEHLCCRKVNLSANLQSTAIYIQEYWHRQGCKCKCSSDIRLVLPKIPKGEYIVQAIITGTDVFTDKYEGKQDTIAKKKITIQ